MMSFPPTLTANPTTSKRCLDVCRVETFDKMHQFPFGKTQRHDPIFLVCLIEVRLDLPPRVQTPLSPGCDPRLCPIHVEDISPTHHQRILYYQRSPVFFPVRSRQGKKRV